MGDHLGSIHFVFFQFGYYWQKYKANQQICKIFQLRSNLEKLPLALTLKRGNMWQIVFAELTVNALSKLLTNDSSWKHNAGVFGSLEFPTKLSADLLLLCTNYCMYPSILLYRTYEHRNCMCDNKPLRDTGSEIILMG